MSAPARPDRGTAAAAGRALAAQPAAARCARWPCASAAASLRLWTQTILAPVVASTLFILVFGLSLGSRIESTSRASPTTQFIVPGLIAMAMAQAAFSNNSSTILQARNDRYINDVLASPMHPWQMNLGYAVGGIFRSLAIGVALVALAIPLTGVPVDQPLALLLAATLLLITLFGALGVIVGIYAQTFDHHSFINNILILPLTFLGGVFYSIDDPALALGGALPREPALLHGQRGPLRVPRRERRQRAALVRGDGGDHGRVRRLVAVSCSRAGHKLKP